MAENVTTLNEIRNRMAAGSALSARPGTSEAHR